MTISARSAAIVVISHYRASSSAKVLATAARSHGKWPTKATAMLRSAWPVGDFIIARRVILSVRVTTSFAIL